ncbi:putative zinc-binding protein (Yippee) [Trypanosoma theileri]|uniref:Putative zinc-binding protein (Yippee) n=1 Tax=Trypanosoma theileri TaxID=67003 RepID=A0A1X0P2F0_9TRYP|nr:putative zinc-binding protein (Yippee) [Trypanosoma theileri]ORC90709.1 putative zinc-binding protein (Yippee) [Trypanosoma theileri]
MGGVLGALAGRLVRDERGESNVQQVKGRKRLRSPSVKENSNGVVATDNEAQNLLLFRTLNANKTLSAPFCRSVLHGASVEDRYGCHYHVYPSESPDDSHGNALCWSVRKSSLSVHSLICLARLANSCHKDLVLFGDGIGVSLSYTATL